MSPITRSRARMQMLPCVLIGHDPVQVLSDNVLVRVRCTRCDRTLPMAVVRNPRPIANSGHQATMSQPTAIQRPSNRPINPSLTPRTRDQVECQVNVPHHRIHTWSANNDRIVATHCSRCGEQLPILPSPTSSRFVGFRQPYFPPLSDQLAPQSVGNAAMAAAAAANKRRRDESGLPTLKKKARTNEGSSALETMILTKEEKSELEKMIRVQEEKSELEAWRRIKAESPSPEQGARVLQNVEQWDAKTEAQPESPSPEQIVPTAESTRPQRTLPEAFARGVDAQLVSNFGTTDLSVAQLQLVTGVLKEESAAMLEEMERNDAQRKDTERRQTERKQMERTSRLALREFALLPATVESRTLRDQRLVEKENGRVRRKEKLKATVLTWMQGHPDVW